MTIGTENELRDLKAIGRIVAKTLRLMGARLEPGMTTAELDDIGAAELARAGARSTGHARCVQPAESSSPRDASALRRASVARPLRPCVAGPPRP